MTTAACIPEISTHGLCHTRNYVDSSGVKCCCFWVNPLRIALLYYRLAILFQEDTNNKKRNEWLQIAYDTSNNIPAIRQDIRELLIDNSVVVKNDLVLGMIYPKGAETE